MKKVLILGLALIVFTGCQPPNESGTKATSVLKYSKDVHGICYATVTSKTYGFFQVVSIATVPCDKVGL